MDSGKLETVETKTREGIALDKLFDPWQKPYPYWHGIRYDLDKLKSVLTNGLLSWEQAERKGIPGYTKNYKNPWNKEYVSVATREPREVSMDNFIVFIDPAKVTAVDSEELDMRNPYEFADKVDELLIKDEILPTQFLGLLLVSKRDFTPVLTEAQIGRLMAELPPENAIPVFSSKELVWPRRMSHEEIVRMLREKGEPSNAQP